MIAVGDRGYPVRSRVERFRGKIISVVSDEVTTPAGTVVVRDYVRHPGAVGVVALDARGRVLLIRQYRHPVGYPLWELPAGLLDVAGEPPLDAAHRELEEEGGITATRWHVLADARTSPGLTDEAIRIYLARDVTAIPDAERFQGEAEEADLELRWVDLDDAVGRALAGEIENAMCLLGVLACVRARDAGWAPLRPPDAPWPARQPA